MSYIADLHIHSKYSRATSRDMNVESLVKWAKLKGIAMLGTGDFTHPEWLEELKAALEKSGNGVYNRDGIDFILSAEVSNIYFKAGRTRKVHNIIFAPAFEIAEDVNEFLSDHGDLASDGRPILSLECDKMAKNLARISDEIMIVPAHAWTPHFSIFGSRSGFDSPEECFESETPRILSIETGLSSDPPMNWRWSKLDPLTLISNSDAHSPSRLGREANVFKDKIDYGSLKEILKTKDKSRFLYTVEFFPEEGKYHWDGHRSCNSCLPPDEARRFSDKCPVCGKNLTVGVMHRVEDMADRKKDYVLQSSPGFKRLVPLAEIIGDALSVGPDSLAVEKEYFNIIKNLGSELKVLLEVPEKDILQMCPPKIARGILNVRNGNLEISPGYDGEYGKIKVFKDGEEAGEKQLKFF